jgi:hypothetical protein
MHGLRRALNHVPLDDRAATLIDWLDQLIEAHALEKKGGIEFTDAVALVAHPSSYPLVEYLNKDDDNNDYAVT